MDYKHREATPMIRTSVLISPDFYKLSREYHIKFSEALRVGLSIILAEKGVTDYDNKLNIHRKMMLFKQQAEEALTKLNEIKDKLPIRT
jgi:hypothetical protein